MMGRMTGVGTAGLLAGALACAPASAAPAMVRDVAPLLLEAAQRQPAVQAGRAALSAAEAREVVANRGLWPTLTVSSGASVLQGQVFGAFAGGAATGLPGGLGGLPLAQDQVWPNAGLTLAQPVFDGGRAWATGEAAAEARESARLRAEEVRRRSVYVAWLAWLDALDLDGETLALDARIATARERVQRARLEQKTGTGRELAVLQAELDLARVGTERRHNDAALSALLQDIGRRYGIVLPTGRLPSLVLALPGDLRSATATASQTVRAAEAGARSAEALARARAAGRWPQASAFVTTTAAGRDLGLSTTLGGATLTWQPLDFGRQGAAEQEAGAQAEQARLEADAAKLDHVRELQDSLLRRAREQETVQHARSLLQLAMRAREQTEARRQNGTADLLESLEREEAVVLAQVALERGERALLRGELAVARALDLPPELLLPVSGRP
ncbi:MAG: TolC family protein [Candidatus Sericytochromatia bacterium]|nr:TolC family protein [Candidatus Sericytochromatia bacterium]